MTVAELYDILGADYNEAVGRLMSEKLISKYIIKFLDDPSYARLMEVWKGDKNEEELFKAAHTLKGVGLNLALSNINQYVLPITENYRPKNSVKVDNVEELFDKLEKEYNISVMKIREFAKSQQ